MEPQNPNQMPPLSNEMQNKSKGPLISVIIILVLIIVGGLYFLRERSNTVNYKNTNNQIETITADLKNQGTADDLESIEADLKATNIDSLDQGASVIDYELQ